MYQVRGPFLIRAFLGTVCVTCVPGSGMVPDRQGLDARVQLLRDHVYAKSTIKTYKTYLSTYYEFCTLSGIVPVPISQLNLSRYIAFLSYRLRYASIINYLSVVRLLHLEAGFPNPLDSYFVSTVQKGARRFLGDATSPKLPITPKILLGIRSMLSFDTSFEVAFWAAALVAFFSFFRKSNLLPDSEQAFNPDRQLSRHNIVFSSEGAVIQVNWSKTIQFKDRVLRIPLPLIPSSRLCPSTALWLSLRQGPASDPSPFQYWQGDRWRRLVYPAFCSHLRQCLDRLGFESKRYSGHSFRRGGATFALESGVSPDLVQTQGDWRSDAYKLYIDPSLQGRRLVANTMAKAVQSLY